MTDVRRMFDAIDLDAIPPAARLLAGYVDGRDTARHAAAVRARFPKAELVTITVTGASLAADVADVETGDLSPDAGADWARRKLALGHGNHPTLYCSLSPWADVRAACRRAGLDPDVDVSWWIAAYDNDPTILPGAIAKQYAGNVDAAAYGGKRGHQLDVSSVAPYWPGVDGPPPGPPPGSLTVPPSNLFSPAWLERSPITEPLGWREASKLGMDDRRAVYAPGGQRLMPWPDHGWIRPQRVPAGEHVPGWLFTSTGWRHVGTP